MLASQKFAFKVLVQRWQSFRLANKPNNLSPLGEKEQKEKIYRNFQICIAGLMSKLVPGRRH